MGLIIGICSARCGEELTNMTINDASDRGDILFVKIPDTKTHKQRKFIVTNQIISVVNAI